MKSTFILTFIMSVLCVGISNTQITWNTFSTDYGQIQLGPANTSWGHIYTDRPAFLFNKEVAVSGGGFRSYSSDLFLKTNTTTRLMIKASTGNIGVNTLNPLAKFHVNGEGRFENGLAVYHNVTGDWGYGLAVWINRDLTKAFTINSSNNQENLFTIWGNGVVNAKKIYAEEIVVRPDAMTIYWPDYVFKDGYKLYPLSKLEDFININGHLPNVPSEKEVMENGVNLGDMNAILLEKIEELTLYVIELKKDIDKLNEEVEHIKKKNKRKL